MSIVQPKVLGLDVSTKTIGWDLFDLQTKELLELSHFSPRVNPRPEDKVEEHLKKCLAFDNKLQQVKDYGITKVIIEQPLLTSNNSYTVGRLLRYNSMIVKSVFDNLGIVSEFISTYDSRKYGHPDLYSENANGKKVLFGGFPKDIDKKKIVWNLVREQQPDVTWMYSKNGNPKKECYDMADAYTCVMGFMRKNELW